MLKGLLLIPKKMLEYAGVEKELVLFGWGNKIEVWSPENYNTILTKEPENFAALAEEVMGKLNLNTGGGNRDVS